MNKEVFLKLSLISKGVIATCALVGFLMEMFLHGWHSIRYYTNQSNLLVVIFLITLLLKYRKEGHWSQWDIRLKGGMTVAILLTGLVYHFMLAPLKTPEEFWTIENFLVHYLIKGIVISGGIHFYGRFYHWRMQLFLLRLR